MRPMAERKPIGPYILFSNVMRPQIRDKNPDAKNHDLMKIAG